MHTGHVLRAVVAIGLLGCGQRGPGPAWTPETAWRLEEDLRLGTAGEDRPFEQFANIAAVLTDSAGSIYVLEAQAQEVRVFDSDGTFSHRIGRRGEGPGELSSASGLNFGPDGRLWVWDTAQGYNVFELDGTFVTRHARKALGVLFPWRGEFGPDGQLYDWGIDFPETREGAPVDASRVIFYPIRVSKDFRTLDTLPPLEYVSEASGNSGIPFGGGLTFYQDRQGSIFFAHTREYTIYRRTLEGDTIGIFTLPATPAKVTEAERDAAVAQFAQFPPQFRPAREDIPDFKPIVRRIFSDNEGYVFVVPEVEGVPAGAAVDVFTDEGTYLGRMQLPQRMTFLIPAPYATRDHLYVVVTDELDVPYVSRLRIVRP